MNLTQESEELSLSLLQSQIEDCITKFETTSDKQVRRELRKKYKSLINQYHQWTTHKVWKENLQ